MNFLYRMTAKFKVNIMSQKILRIMVKYENKFGKLRVRIKKYIS